MPSNPSCLSWPPTYTYLLKSFCLALGFGLRGLHLLGKLSATWAVPLVIFFFALVIFQIGSCTFARGLPGLWSSYLYLLHK
jgi:hypothetical protein